MQTNVSVNRRHVEQIRAGLQSTDGPEPPAVQRVREAAEAWLASPPPSVTHKQPTPHSPTTDRNDFVSAASYFWPNPDTDDGLPYVHRDGQVSPDVALYDRLRWDAAAASIVQLTRAAYLTEAMRFADGAAERLRVWFLDADTRMNPHIRHGAMIAGRTPGRATGIIHIALYLPEVLEHATFLAEFAPDSWSAADQAALLAWCDALLNWLETHPFGAQEERMRNNHGTYYDRLIVSLAMHLDRPQRAAAQLAITRDRIGRQITPSGTMPHELRRTCSFGYALMNTRAFVELAIMAQTLDVELWGYTADNGSSIPAAVDGLYQFAASADPWPHQQIEPIDWRMLWSVFSRANRLAKAPYDDNAIAHRLPEGFDPDLFSFEEPLHPFGATRSPQPTRDALPGHARIHADDTAVTLRLNEPDVWQDVIEAIRQAPEALASLARAADEWLDVPVLTVVDKQHVAPSGDPHDYVSMGPYWWPNPDAPDGLPYVVRDGEVNPDFYAYDRVAIESLVTALSSLVPYARVANSAPHARQAGRLLRGWFIDEATRMNPHMRYAQFVPGRDDGRWTGIIDTVAFVFMLDAVGQLPSNAEWTAAHLAALKAWFSEYLDWLLESEFGRRERAQRNNHGSWYDAQVVAYALFCGREDVARRQIEQFALPRLAAQIEADGSQPEELRRTLTLTYSTYNLIAHACVARLAQPLGMDLWQAGGAGGGHLLRALRWMEPYYAGRDAWPHKQIVPFDTSVAALLLNLAWQGTGAPEWLALSEKLAEHPTHRVVFSNERLTGRTYPHPQRNAGLHRHQPTPAGYGMACKAGGRH